MKVYADLKFGVYTLQLVNNRLMSIVQASTELLERYSILIIITHILRITSRPFFSPYATTPYADLLDNVYQSEMDLLQKCRQAFMKQKQ